MNFITKNKEGFTDFEIDDLLSRIPNIDREKFYSLMFGNTCMIINDQIIKYHSDVEYALHRTLGKDYDNIIKSIERDIKIDKIF